MDTKDMENTYLKMVLKVRALRGEIDDLRLASVNFRDKESLNINSFGSRALLLQAIKTIANNQETVDNLEDNLLHLLGCYTAADAVYDDKET